MRRVFVLLIPLALVAQSGPRIRPRSPEVQAPALKPEDLCTVQGQVVNALTGEPLRKAALTLRRAESGPAGAGLPRSYGATSDSAGRFLIPGVAPGKYRLSAARTGFVEAEYGTPGPQRAGTTLALDPGKNLGDLLLRLMPHGVLTGRVVDEDGEPMESVHVQALRYHYSQGRKHLSPFGSASTNDLGEYRVYGLPPGRYYLSVTPQRSYSSSRSGRAAPPPPADEYVLTYYPGTLDLTAATPVDLGPGAQVRGLDLSLSKRHTVRVLGHVTDTTGSGRHLTIYLVAANSPGFSTMRRPSAIDPNGNFEIRGVTPGSYTLVAVVPGRGTAATARVPVQVASSDVENVSLTINPPMTVSGHVRVDGQTTASLSSIRLSLRSRDPDGMQFGPGPAAAVLEDGGFTLPGVNPDRYGFLFSGLPDGCYVKAILAGGQDVLAAGLDLSGGAAAPLDVVLSPNAGQVTGAVQNDQQQPAAAAIVVLIPQEAERRDQPQYYRTTSTDAAGRFALKNVDPGQYKVYAWEEVGSGSYLDPDFVRPVENRGTALTIREGAQEDVQLRLIS